MLVIRNGSVMMDFISTFSNQSAQDAKVLGLQNLIESYLYNISFEICWIFFNEDCENLSLSVLLTRSTLFANHEYFICFRNLANIQHQ